MSAAIMSPIHNISCAALPLSSPLSSPPPSALPLSRSAATYYVPSSSMLPRPSLLSWSLDHSCTTFQLAAAFATKAQHTKGHGASAIASAARRLIDDDPDRDEEDHIRGIKRNRRSTMVSVSPTIPSKRRCYSSTATATATATLMLPGMCGNYGKRDFDFDVDFDFDRGADTTRSSSEGIATSAGSEFIRWSSREGNTAKFLLPQQKRVPKPPHRHSEIPTKSDSGSNSDRDCNSDQDRTTLSARGTNSNGNGNGNINTATATDRDNDSYSNTHNESSHYTDCAPVPEPPGFRRHSTIRDSFDLAYSIDEFSHGMITS